MIKIKQTLYAELVNAFCHTGIEKGGLLRISNQEIISYIQDEDGICDDNTYIPSQNLGMEITAILQAGDSFAFVHSHPKNWGLSTMDVLFIKEYLSLNQEDVCLTAILQGESLNLFEITAETDRGKRVTLAVIH